MSERYIVMNVTPGPVYIVDLGLSIDPLSTVDLSNRNADEVKGSNNLRNALRSGFVRKIDEKEYDRLERKKVAEMRKSVTKVQEDASAGLRRQRVGDRDMDVEPINVDHSAMRKMSQEVSTAGYANDPLSYAVALEIAQANASKRGRVLYVEDFAKQVAGDPDIVRQLINNHTEGEVSDSAYDEEADDMSGGGRMYTRNADGVQSHDTKATRERKANVSKATKPAAKRSQTTKRAAAEHIDLRD